MPDGVTPLIADRHDTHAMAKAVAEQDMVWDLVVDCICYDVPDIRQDIDLFRVPGAWELPSAVSRVATNDKYHGVVALGCVIRGGTPHFEYVAGEATRGLGAVARNSTVPVSLGVLTTDTVDQALERAGTKAGNKGWDAALSVLEMAGLFEAMG